MAVRIYAVSAVLVMAACITTHAADLGAFTAQKPRTVRALRIGDSSAPFLQRAVSRNVGFADFFRYVFHG